MTKIYHAHLYGSREDKYQVLSENTINTTDFTELDPQKPFYLLIPQDNDLLTEYNKGFAINEIIEINSLGITTARDSLTIQWNQQDLKKVITDFAYLEENDARKKYDLGSDSLDWKITLAQKDLIESGLHDNNIYPIYYRPFDFRTTYYTGKSQGFHCRPRNEIMFHLKQKDNFGLCFIRRSRENSISNFFVVKGIVDKTLLSSKDNANVAPLYIYPAPNAHKKLQEKRSNFSQDFLKQVENNLGYLPTPEEIFYYIYAIFHSPTYRTRYAEFLKIDFPRVPITNNKKLFTALSELGEQLVQLHLMTSPRLDKPITKFIKESDQIVATGHPKYNKGKVYINKTDYFQNVPEEVWNFHIGGYQVSQKWLKDRKGRTLSVEDITHYQKIIVALAETIKLMEKIDQTIPSFPIE